MAQVEVRPRQAQTPKSGRRRSRLAQSWMSEWWFRLLALLFLTELIVPFLLWKAGLPRTTDFLKEIVAAAIVILTFGFILLRNRIPAAVLLLLGVTFIWGIVAFMEGQDAGATLWGWWRFFKYPLLGVFAYLIPRWPADFARWLVRLCIIILVFQVLVQFAQYATGTPTGDSLAGTFGWKGVAQYSMFLFFVVCLALGHWLATQEWKLLLLTLTLGLIGSTLNGTKFYMIAVVMLGLATLILHLIRGGQFRQLFIYIALFSLSIGVLLPLYNAYQVQRGLRPLQEYLQPEVIENYIFNDGKGDEDGKYNLGRGLALTYAWQQIRRDNTTTLFGYGIGSRTYSTALGLTGRSLEEDLYGAASETGLGAWIQEFGVVGFLLFLTFNVWAMWKLLRFARQTPDPYQAAIAFGLILFTLFWPIWLWYHRPWVAGVMMTLYWVSLGYTFRQIYTKPRRAADRREPDPQPALPATDALPAAHLNGGPSARRPRR